MNHKTALLGPVDRSLPGWQKIAITLLACCATTLLATPLIGHLDEANIVMLFLLTVLLVAIKLGRAAAVTAAFFSVLLFDFFFVPPRFSLAVNDAQYLVTFAVMLFTALVTAHLATGLRAQARIAATREQQAHALYEVARDLAGALTVDQVGEITGRFLRSMQMEAGLMLPDREGKITATGAEPHLARMAFDSGKPVECDAFAGSGQAVSYFPLRGPMRVRGVLAVSPAGASLEQVHEQKTLLETLASLIAITLERLHYVEVAQSTQLQVVSERLRSSILSALSHDLRTPLTALVGLADSLTISKPSLSEAALETAQAMHEQATRLAGLVGNLLDMARLHAGQVTLRPEWQPIEEVIGASIKLLGSALARHPVRVSLPGDLPLLQFDAVLVERVFCNLLENAAKYSPPDSAIEITARQLPAAVEVSICDHGSGFSHGQQEDCFEMFARGQGTSTKPGAGLGLAICRAIVEAHAGEIHADNLLEGGACLRFTLPTGTPPIIEEEAV